MIIGVASVDIVEIDCLFTHTSKRGVPHLFALWRNHYAATQSVSSDICIDTRRDPIRVAIPISVDPAVFKKWKTS